MQIYIHIPFCKSKCQYCDFNSFPQTDAAIKFSYLAALRREIAFAGERFSHATVDTIYIGGGTPSVLSAGEFESLCKALNASFDLSRLKEFTIECNPESISSEKLEAYRQNGVNRISVGVQSLNDRNLKTVGRLHTSAQAIEKLNLAAQYFDNVSADVIIGLPYDDKTVVGDELSELSQLVQHISVYQLTLAEGTPLAARAQKNLVALPTDDEVADYQDIAIDTLINCGFQRYEVSNFAKDDKISLHNYGYWTRQKYIGLGAGAHSLVKTAANGENLPADIRFASPKDLNAYIAGVNCADCFDGVPRVDINVISPADAVEESIMLGLRTSSGVKRELLEGRIPADISRFFESSGDNIRLTRDGMAIMNSLLIRVLRFGE